MRDEDLKSQTDYSTKQKEAAQRVLIEIVNLLNEYRDVILIIGGWVPDLLFPNQGHVGSIDVDLLLNHLKLPDPSYKTIKRILQANGYQEHPEKYFSFRKKVIIDEGSYDVDLDLLAGMYGGTHESKGSQHVHGFKALKATGGNFAFEVPAIEVTIEAKRPDGAFDSGKIRVISIVPFLVMKAAALGRGKAKDAYDIYFCIKHFPGGVRALAVEFMSYSGHGIVLEMKEKLQGKFSSPEHAGPIDVASFLELYDSEENELIKRDAFEQISMLLDLLE